jgi:tetratricopeptide (TPR) repeat protein
MSEIRSGKRPAIMKSHRCPHTLAVCIALFLAVQSVLFGQTMNDRVALIVSALSSRQFDKALQLLQPALQSAPNNPQLWMFQGLAYSGKGDPKSALDSYQKAIKLSPDYLPALEGAAQLEYEANSADAVPLLEHVLRLRPQDTTSHAMLAVLAYKSGDCPTAVRHFSESESILAAQPGALQEYGVCLLKLKQTDKALRIFQGLLDSQPNDSRARRGLATIELAAGQPKDALSTLQPLLDSNPDVSTMQLAAAAYEANKNTPDAVRVLREAIVRNPHEVALYLDFADIAMNHQSFQAGIEMIDSGLKLQPGAAELYLARGVLYVQLADYDKAEDDFERAEQLDPSQGLSATAQGMMAEERNESDPDQALATVRSSLAKKPGDAFLWYLQAAILSKKAPEPGSPEFQEGMTSARKAVALDPSLMPAHNVLSKYYLDSGQYPVAAQECRKVLEQNPTDQTALYHLVLALRKTNQQAEIPDLLKRLAKARQEATKQEAERNRYKLVVSTPPPN